ncbi:MAG: 1-acyl-sn-glycerol-3-phosphate acyltransferase [Myxococcota bacterium]
MLFLGDVDVFDPTGGPWGRGYLKSTVPIAGDEWFFDGHFLNDPCMPGTLMLEGCAQAMAFYLAALGFTVDKDSWRFQPIPHETYKLLCRGQVTPASRELTYELFIEEVHEGPEPMLYADLLCTVDGLGAFHARRFGLKLTPAWPLHEVTRGTEEGRLLSEGEGDPRTALASYRGGEPFRFDYPSLLACAWGKPSAAFGPMYERFDGTRRVARLPGPPYHFLSRVTSIAGELGGMQAGSKVTFEYDVPPDAWYFGDNGAPVMPFAVLLEAALQPCGWVASFVGSALDIETDLLFRNLDGKGVILADVTPESGVFHTSVEITNISKSAGMIIESFRVRCHTRDAGGRETPIYELDTVFGFFPPEAFVDQAGLPTTEEQRALLERPANTRLDLTKRQGRLFEGGARLASGRMLMLDRVTYLDLDGGEEGLGVLRGEKDVDPGEWFFKAHFFQDPVQPGSLGLEAMLQGIQLLMLEKGAGLGWPELDHPAARFESIGTQDEHVWKYRGQVVPTNGLIGSTVELLELGRDARGPVAVARASLWVDGKRIYEAPRFGMRIVTGPAGPGDAKGGSRGPKAPEPSAAAGEGDEADQSFVREVILDPDKDLWIGDHRPTYTRPALPLMAIADLLVQAAREAGHAAEGLEGLEGLEVQRWVVVDRPTRLRVEVEGDEARLLVWREAPKAALSRFERAASARLRVPEAMAPLRPLEGGRAAPLYEGDRLFHGPAFRYGVALTERAGGARLWMDAGKGAVPMGAIHPGLLDAATHAIPHDALQRWAPELGDGFVAYPRRLDLRVEGGLPAHGEVVAEVRLDGIERSPERPPFAHFRIDLHAGGARIAALRLTEVLLPKGPLGRAAPPARRRFLEGRVAPGVALSSRAGPTTALRHDDVAVSRWFPGVLEDVYGDARPEVIAAKEHVAAKAGAHPREVRIEHAQATLARLPLTRFDLTLEPVAGAHRVTSRERLTRAPLEAFWSRHFGLGRWPVEDLYFGLVERFLGRVVVTEPDAFETLRGRPALFLANHQTGIESLLFSIVAGALLEVPALTLAKAEHRESWLGRLIAHCFSWPGASDPGVIAFFDRSDPTSLPRIAGELEDEAGARSLMVHVEGTRAERGGAPVDTMSGIWCDLALRASVPIVPVRFARGLPLEGVPEKLEYPFAMGPQDLIIGAPLRPETLAALPYKERSERVRHAINALTPELDTPQRPDPALARRVAAAMQARQVGVGLATVGEVLADLETRHPLLDALFAAQAEDGRETPAPSSGAGVEERAWLAGLSALLGFRARA